MDNQTDFLVEITSATATNDNQVVLLPIHGTFARWAGWIRADSSWLKALAAKIGCRCWVPAKPFRWSSWNSHPARARAGDNLQRFLRHVHEVANGRGVYVICHSHGGTVLAYALRDEKLASQLKGLIFIATPFMRITRRELAYQGPLVAAGAMFIMAFIGSLTDVRVLFASIGAVALIGAIGGLVGLIRQVLSGSRSAEREPEPGSSFGQESPTSLPSQSRSRSRLREALSTDKFKHSNVLCLYEPKDEVKRWFRIPLSVAEIPYFTMSMGFGLLVFAVATYGASEVLYDGRIWDTAVNAVENVAANANANPEMQIPASNAFNSLPIWLRGGMASIGYWCICGVVGGGAAAAFLLSLLIPATLWTRIALGQPASVGSYGIFDVVGHWLSKTSFVYQLPGARNRRVIYRGCRPASLRHSLIKADPQAIRRMASFISRHSTEPSKRPV